MSWDMTLMQQLFWKQTIRHQQSASHADVQCEPKSSLTKTCCDICGSLVV